MQKNALNNCNLKTSHQYRTGKANMNFKSLLFKAQELGKTLNTWKITGTNHQKNQFANT